jgi:hypothetical protein
MAHVVGVTLCLAAGLAGCASGAPSAAPSLDGGPTTDFSTPLASDGGTSDPTAGPGAMSSSLPGDSPHGFASRLLMPFLDVDLAVLPGMMDAEGNPEFPLCDVAQYLPYYSQPGAAGTTYLYAHARRGMLLSMLEQSKVDDGVSMLGNEVIVYTSASWRHVYTITAVKPHATDYTIADDVAPGEQRLVVQTSEGRVGDPFKLQIAADPVTSSQVTLEEALASPMPRDCAPTE